MARSRKPSAAGTGCAAQRGEREPRHVDAARDGEPERARHPRVDLEQRRAARRVALALHVGDVGDAPSPRRRPGRTTRARGRAPCGRPPRRRSRPGRAAAARTRSRARRRPASTSIEYSSPGRNSWTSRPGARSSAASSAAEPTFTMPRDPLPDRGLTMTGYVHADGSVAGTERLGPRHADDPGAVLGERQLVEDDVKRRRGGEQQVDAVRRERRAGARPAAAARRRPSAGRRARRAPGTGRAATSVKSGAAPAGTSVRDPGGTR